MELVSSLTMNWTASHCAHALLLTFSNMQAFDFIPDPGVSGFHNFPNIVFTSLYCALDMSNHRGESQ